MAVLDQFIGKALLQVVPARAGLWQSIDGIHHQVEAIHVIEHRHIKRRGCGTFFHVTVDAHLVMVWSTVGQAMN